MNKNKKSPPLTFAQYQRLYNVVHTLANHWTKDSGRSCVFFSILGAVLMNKHYKRDAKVACGNGAVMLDQKAEMAVSWFVQNADGSLAAGPEALHAWIVCDGWLVDLMAPNYREALIGSTGMDTEAQELTASIVPRMMLQKPLDQTEGSPDQMMKAGDCVFVPHNDVTSSVIDTAFERPQLEDIINIALAWHRPLPNSMAPAISITNDLGEITTINLIKRD
ncbi:MAG: hypothetical protein JWN73_5199, partial [Betaproteobacteria bacterium]|nr:hypothetical protein [Betaproteobacteria bacterium]